MTRELEIAATPPGLLKALAERKPFRPKLGTALRFGVSSRNQVVVVLLYPQEEEKGSHAEIYPEHQPGKLVVVVTKTVVVHTGNCDADPYRRAQKRCSGEKPENPLLPHRRSERSALERHDQEQDREHASERSTGIRSHVLRYRLGVTAGKGFS
ncbi:hypothetical protein KK092_04045 [Curtobacterium flaccumfaciens pv. flaccumfaciens]|uniref:hypothetical protein n=1 Tax=Curtobacterium flaccumfaciens TaxID=2035 RepID=UPI001BDE27FB|nr:hypothetical protein [Curtobacterium flaccumfaciens]MBT1668544.1 hypothetical protein [Curtobacterium flaccumfaciens pv. flaccumfaciens]